MSTPASWAMRSELGAAAGDRAPAGDAAAGRLERDAGRRGVDAEHRVAEAQRASGGGDPVGEGAADLAVVDDPALGDVQRLARRRRAARSRAPPRALDEAQALQAVRGPALVQRVQLRQLRVVHGDDELPGQPVRDLVLLGEADQQLAALAAEPAAQRAGRVVQPRVDHAGVAPALVEGDRRPPCRRSRCAARAAAAGARAPSRVRRSRRRSRSGRRGRSSPARV